MVKMHVAEGMFQRRILKTVTRANNQVVLSTWCATIEL